LPHLFAISLPFSASDAGLRQSNRAFIGIPRYFRFGSDVVNGRLHEGLSATVERYGNRTTLSRTPDYHTSGTVSMDFGMVVGRSSVCYHPFDHTHCYRLMFQKIIIGVVLNALAMYVVTKFMPGEIAYTGGIAFFLVSGFVIGLLNACVKPLMKILSFPLLIMTVGLFSLVINAIIFWLTMKLVNVISIADVTVTISGAWTYLVAAIVFGLVNWVLHMFIHKK
jgi:putative membrane protein